jgi:hypothetical protein
VTVKRFLKWVEEKLAIHNLDDWRKVTYIQIRQLGGGSLLNKFGGLLSLLKAVYPNHNWQKAATGSYVQMAGKSQVFLTEIVTQLLPPGTTIICNYKIASSSPTTAKPVTAQLENQLEVPSSQQQRRGEKKRKEQERELDIYCPSLSLAFEYQGEFHYHDKYEIPCALYHVLFWFY